MQDEPEPGVHFQHKMSLNREWGIGCILRVYDHHHAERRAVDPDRDTGVCRGQSGSPVDCWRATTNLRFPPASAGGPAVSAVAQRPERDRAAMLAPADGPEPGSAHPLDPTVAAERVPPGSTGSPAPLSRSLHAPGHRVAGGGRRELVRPGCCTSCWWSSPSRGPTAPPTTPW